MKKIIFLLFLMGLISQSAFGAFCDYTPSNLIGGQATGAVGVGAGATAATGIGMKAAARRMGATHQN